MSPTKKDGELDGAQIEDERWFGSLRAPVPYSAGEHGTLRTSPSCQLLSPIAAKVVAGVVRRSSSRGCESRADARSGAEAVYAALHVPACRGRIHQAQTRRIGR